LNRSRAIVALVALLALVSCSDGGPEVTTEGEPGDEVSTSVSDETTITLPEPTTPTTAPRPADDVSVDPAEYVTAPVAAEFAALGEESYLLPTTIPDWAVGGLPLVIVDTFGNYLAKWSIRHGTDPRTIEAGSGFRIEFNSERLTEDDVPLKGETRSTGARSYVLYPRGDCGEEGADFAVAGWDEGGRRYTVIMTPTPECADGFTVEDALAFADSAVACTADMTSVRC
jgi:hypothetical protein